MGKTLVINLNDVVLKGDILDVGERNLGIIYNISKEAYNEISIDYVDDSRKNDLRKHKYDACTFFFELSSMWTNFEKERIIERMQKLLKENGEILIWDINKQRGGVINNRVKVIMPNEDVKEFNFRNLNIFGSNDIEDIKKILAKNFEIEETKAWEDVFFIRARKIQTALKKEENKLYENITYSY